MSFPWIALVTQESELESIEATGGSTVIRLALAIVLLAGALGAALYILQWNLWDRGPTTTYVSVRTNHRPNSYDFAVVTATMVYQRKTLLMSSGMDVKEFTFRVLLCDAFDSTYKRVAVIRPRGDSFDAIRVLGWDRAGSMFFSVQDGQDAPRLYRVSKTSGPKQVTRLPDVESEGESAVPMPTEKVYLRVHAGPLSGLGTYELGVLSRAETWSPILRVDSLNGEVQSLRLLPRER